MTAQTKTKTGSVVEKGVEYNHYPPPKALIKIMKRRYAFSLIRSGSLRLGNVTFYRKMENDQLGDPNDGLGMFHMQGHPYTTSTSNPMFVWCMSLPQISKKRILEIARSENYDCVLKVNDPEEFLQRIRRCLEHGKKRFWVHCGTVRYNRGKEVSKRALNSQQFNYNIFQKSQVSRRDREYRLSLTDLTYNQRKTQFIKFTVGKCSDIMTIENLPNKINPADGKKHRR
jgi:hypothetical protein